MLRLFVEGVSVNAETLAEEAIHSVGPRGSFLSSRHTRSHLRQIWQPLLLERGSWEDWEKRGKPSAEQNAREKVREILSRHQPLSLPGPDRIREIIQEYEKRSSPL